MDEPSRPSASISSRRLVYGLAFIRNCHRWLAAGYAILDVHAFSKAEEPAITGELVRAMKEAKLKPGAPTWMIRMYVADDPPVNAPGRLGKQRRRVDIEFERSERGSAFRFHCEAKRLYRSDSVREYLGGDGLGMFLTGEYAREENNGGMLGYVQSETAEIWLSRLRGSLEANRSMNGMGEDKLVQVDIVPELPQVHRSVHNRPSLSRDIIIYHTLLIFTGDSWGVQSVPILPFGNTDVLPIVRYSTGNARVVENASPSPGARSFVSAN